MIRAILRFRFYFLPPKREQNNLKIYTVYKNVQMMLKRFFDISTGFRFSKISVECSVHLCSCPWITQQNMTSWFWQKFNKYICFFYTFLFKNQNTQPLIENAPHTKQLIVEFKVQIKMIGIFWKSILKGTGSIVQWF